MSTLLQELADALLASSPNSPGDPGGTPWSSGPPIGTGGGGPPGFGGGGNGGDDGRGGGGGGGGGDNGGENGGGGGDNGDGGEEERPGRKKKKRVTLKDLLKSAKKAAEDMYDIGSEAWDFHTKDYEDMDQNERDVHDALHGRPRSEEQQAGDELLEEMMDKALDNLDDAAPPGAGEGIKFIADQAEKTLRGGAAGVEGAKHIQDRSKNIDERIARDTQQESSKDDD
ncbi:hypothetical protein [Nocardioides sp. AE5]|uniref:hypothetical protein n=1 Tax=Nocardioides sp. AE5 TaxID=2962573 RepID=UPI002882D288|nr:hypothetical protein [Nocardioides sp. AE5]MDT0203086.1 hypothetical protein [Nocardioides sp. AE5]